MATMQNHASEIHGLMSDTWNENLRCPLCRNTGRARVSQHPREEILGFECVTEGFMVVTGQYGSKFYCSTCYVAAEP